MERASVRSDVSRTGEAQQGNNGCARARHRQRDRALVSYCGHRTRGPFGFAFGGGLPVGLWRGWPVARMERFIPDGKHNPRKRREERRRWAVLSRTDGPTVGMGTARDGDRRENPGGEESKRKGRLGPSQAVPKLWRGNPKRGGWKCQTGTACTEQGSPRACGCEFKVKRE